MIQWHHFNSTGTPQQDASKVQMCTVPTSARKNIAGITFLGTEEIAIPPGGDTARSAHVHEQLERADHDPRLHAAHAHDRLAHDVGRDAREGGKTEMVFDKPFVFDQQVNYKQDPLLVLQPGDTIESTCTWTNNTDGLVTLRPIDARARCATSSRSRIRTAR